MILSLLIVNVDIMVVQEIDSFFTQVARFSDSKVTSSNLKFSLTNSIKNMFNFHKITFKIWIFKLQWNNEKDSDARNQNMFGIFA